MTIFQNYAEICCYKCGIQFGVPMHWHAKRKEDGASFWCPNGHSQHYTESEADKLRRERDLLKQQMARKDDEIAAQKRAREAAERSASAARGQVTRLRNRAQAGLCPCCNRHFTNLERHMATKHKDQPAEAMAELNAAREEALRG